MKRTHLERRTFAVVWILSLAGMGGCIEYTIETTLEANGSGARSEEIVVETSGGSEESGGLEDRISNADFEWLMSLGSDRWKHSSRVEDGDTLHVFQRQTRVRDLASWSGLSGDVHIAGATAARSGTWVGRVRLGDVHFRNAVQVESGSVTGGTSYAYTETFYWENILDVLIAWYARYVESTIVAQYSDLPADDRSEIIGLVKGGLWSAIDQGLLDASGDEEERLMSAFIERATQQSMRIIRRHYSSADADVFARMLRQAYEDDQDKLESFITADLPGVELAVDSEIIFRLNMPGRVTDSNAHDRDGTTLIWKFGPGDAVQAPIEIFARSVVEGQ